MDNNLSIPKQHYSLALRDNIVHKLSRYCQSCTPLGARHFTTHSSNDYLETNIRIIFCRQTILFTTFVSILCAVRNVHGLHTFWCFVVLNFRQDFSGSICWLNTAMLCYVILYSQFRIFTLIQSYFELIQIYLFEWWSVVIQKCTNCRGEYFEKQ